MSQVCKKKFLYNSPMSVLPVFQPHLRISRALCGRNVSWVTSRPSNTVNTSDKQKKRMAVWVFQRRPQQKANFSFMIHPLILISHSNR